MDSIEIIPWILMGFLVIAVFVVMVNQEQKLEDPNNTEVVYLHQLRDVYLAEGPGTFCLRIFRQSGNLQQEERVFGSIDGAIKAAVATFKRAKIEYVVITENSEDGFNFRRPFHDHRGQNEGKKVGSVEIFRVR